MHKVRNAVFASVSAIAITSGAGAAYGQIEPAAVENGARISWEIPAQPLGDALIDWSARSNYVVLVQDDLTAGIRTRGVTGSLTKLEALERLLASSGLAYRLQGEQTLVVVPALQTASMSAGPETALASGPNASRPLRLAQASDGSRQDRLSRADNKPGDDHDEIIVTGTGTRIRGALPAAPIETITREDIEMSGQSQTGELLRSLPQTFRGGLNPTVQPTTVNTNSGLASDSTVNLRGMGPDATLILVNGRRLAPIGGGETTDISAIPLSALERVDVLLDGSSALYGADAVAGVVNFIIADDYDGAELRARTGGATQGGGFEQAYSAAAGTRWNGGSILAGADYLKQEPIFTGQRDFSETAGPLNSLLAANRQWSGFLSGTQEIDDAITLDLIGLYTQRRTSRTTEYGAGGFADATETETNSYFLAPRATFELPAGWIAQIEGSVARSVREAQANDSFGGGFASRTENSGWTIGAMAEGAALRLPSGEVRMALGGGYREEALDADLGGIERDGARNVAYAFTELSAPLVAPSDERFGLNSLDLNFAIRVEDHTGFGTATTPKVGVRYVPFPALSLRGTWGKSFRAPRFDHLLADNVVTLWNAANLGSMTPGLAFLDFSGNPALEPERATSWTAGFDFAPEFLSGFDLSFTWFDIDFRDRIVSPITNLGSALSDPAHLPFIDPNPPAAAQSALIDGADLFFNISGLPYDPAQVIAIVHSGFVNASAQEVSGADLSLHYTTGDLSLFSNLSWLRISSQTLEALPMTRQSGLIFQPASFRARGGASWAVDDGFIVSAIVNHVAGSRDNVAFPAGEISSWTTLDLTLQYQLRSLSSALDGFEASLSVTNALDNDPPFAAGGGVAFPGMFFDSANTSPIGRFVAATLRYEF